MYQTQGHYTATYHPDGYAYFGTTCREHVVIVRPHKKGLSVYDSRQLYARGSRGTKKYGRASRTRIIPGQYSLSQFAEWIEQITGNSPTLNDRIITLRTGHETSTAKLRRIRRIKKVLQDSGMWECRGYLQWSDTPKDFFRLVPIGHFLHGTTQSYRAWWKQFVAHHCDEVRTEPASDVNDDPFGFSAGPLPSKRDNQERGKRRYYHRLATAKQFIDEGKLPELPHQVKGWGSVPVTYLASDYMKHIADKETWTTLVDQVLPRFPFRLLEDVFPMVLHGEAGASSVGEAVKYLVRLEANVSPSLLRRASRLAYDRFLVKMNLTKRNELRVLVSALARYKKAVAAHCGRGVTDAYIPPPVNVPAGWSWGTHETIDDVVQESGLFCSVAREIADGTAHLLYRTDANRGNGIVVIEWRKGEWSITASQPNVEEMNPFFQMNLNGILRRMNEDKVPGGTPLPQAYRDALAWSAVRRSTLAKKLCRAYHDAASPYGSDGVSLRPPKRTSLIYRDPQAVIARERSRFLARMQHGLDGIPF